MKTFGIYLAYPPTVDLRAEGLGRLLAEFLKGAQDRDDIRFVIACPSWTRTSLVELFDATNVSSQSFELIAPRTVPLLLKAYQHAVSLRRKSRRLGGLRRRIIAQIGKWTLWLRSQFERQMLGTRSILWLTLCALVAIPLIAIAIVANALAYVVSRAFALLKTARARIIAHAVIDNLTLRIHRLATQPKEDSLATRLYRTMEDAEVALLRDLIEAREDVVAWYSPTAFWPHFNHLSAPRLTCVPDVVLIDFPIGFSSAGGDRQFESFRRLEKSIAGGQFFVTYSQEVKWQTLVRRFNVDPDAIEVVPHGANRLDELVCVSGFPDNEDATNTLCRQYFRSALLKAQNLPDPGIFGSNDLRFIFYASQFRPNKNVLTLLEAYKYLLRRRYIGQKLVLTGNYFVPEVASFIAANDLGNDVLFLRALSTEELAACYRLADLAVNPSLSEGACPFTFTEALSVGTPVVMARIPVTEEVICDPNLQALMLFDPYDWEDIAHRIEWALENREVLLERQKPFYEMASKRTWRNVVDEYVAILDRISSTSRSHG